MIAINVVKSAYANEHLTTSFPAEWRCTVNSYRSATTCADTIRLYRQFPIMSISFTNFFNILIFVKLFAVICITINGHKKSRICRLHFLFDRLTHLELVRNAEIHGHVKGYPLLVEVDKNAMAV